MLLQSPHFFFTVLLLVTLHKCTAYEPEKTLPACTRTPPSPQYICGQQGNVQPRDKPIFTYRNVDTVAACHLECLQSVAYIPNLEAQVPSCYSISYNAGLKTCSGFKRTAKAINFTNNPQSNTAIYDSQCFACIYDSPPPANANLLANGGFEIPTSSATAYSPWSIGGPTGSAVNIMTPGFQSASSLRVNASSTDVLLRQTFFRPTNGFYDLTFDYKAREFFPRPWQLETGIGDSYYSTSQLHQPPTASNNTWSTFKGTYDIRSLSNDTRWQTRLENYQMEIYEPHNGNEPNNVYFLDNVKITPSQFPFKAATGAPNMIQNGGFETGTFDEYSIDFYNTRRFNRTLRVVQPGAAGSKYALSLDLGRANLSDIDSVVVSLTQKVPLKTGTEYLLGLSFRIANDTGHCSAIYSLGLTVDDTVGRGSSKQGQYFSFTLYPLQDLFPDALSGYVTYQLPLSSFSSISRADSTWVSLEVQGFREYGSRPDGRGKCVLLVDDLSVKKRA